MSRSAEESAAAKARALSDESLAHALVIAARAASNPVLAAALLRIKADYFDARGVVPPSPSLAGQLLGRIGGKKGGIARAASLSPRRRSEIAQKAARTRWATKETP